MVRRKRNLSIGLAALCLLLAGCSPQDFLTRRLARDLIVGSPTFNNPQQFWMRTGVVSNGDFTSPEYLVLQHHGWISGSNTACTPAVAPPPCWEVALTPIGVDTFRDLVPSSQSSANYFSVPTARRQLVDVTGVSKDGNVADVDFTWKWSPMNEVGAALYVGDAQFTSTVEMKHYDNGWRVLEKNLPKAHQTLEDALKNAEPAR
jgi:hypothetical protein